MAETKWTDDQKNALNCEGNVILSASAGSGKTTVMLQRFVGRLNVADVKDMVVITFNNSVAVELKHKITQKLYELIKEETDSEKRDALRRQIDNLPDAVISTIHGFCHSLLKTDFEQVGLDPSFTVVDEKQADDLRAKALRKVFDRYYDSGDDAFLQLSEIFAKPSDEGGLSDVILKIAQYALNRPQPEEFLEQAKAKCRVPFENSEAVRYITDYFAKRFKALGDLADSRRFVFGRSLPDSFQSVLSHISATGKRAAKARNTDDIFRIVSEENRPAVRLYAKEADKGACEFVKELRDSFNKAVKEAEKYIPDPDALRADYGRNAEVAEKLAEVTSAYLKEYSERKKQLNSLDFNDLEHFALRLLSDKKRAKEISERFSYIFIDEYQDVNYTQEAILSAVISSDNAFMVGDVKQSIYGFRLTEPEIFINRFNRYRSENSGHALPLNDNFRSAPEILDFVNKIFCEIMTKDTCDVDYKNDAAFILRNKDGLSAGKAAVYVISEPDEKKEVREAEPLYSVKNDDFSSEESEDACGAFIADLIEETVKGKEGFRYGDIALLYRSSGEKVKRIIRTLGGRGIPVSGAAFADEKNDREINEINNLIKVIDNPAQDIPLAGFLTGFFGGLTAREAADIRMYAGGEKTDFYTACLKTAQSGTLLGEKVGRILKNLDDWRIKAGYTDVFDFINGLIAKTGYDAYILKGHNGMAALNALNAYLAMIRGKDFASTPRKFARYAESLSDKDFPVPELAGENAVKAVTVHKSKGLEYPVVIYVADDRFNFRNSYSDVVIHGDIGIGVRNYFPDTRKVADSVQYLAAALYEKEKTVKEEMRLLYVALTRAQRRLAVVCKARGAGSAAPENWALPSLLAKSCADFMYDAYFNCPSLRDSFAFLTYGGRKAVKPVRGINVFATDINREDELVNKINNIYNYEYPYYNATRTEQKFTVTALNDADLSAERFASAVNISGDDPRAEGIAYHTVMENIDLGLTDEKQVADAVKNMTDAGLLSRKEAEAVDAAKIFRCISCDLMQYAARNRRFTELPFMLNLPANELFDTSVTDKILIQGTIDLLIMGEKNIIVDFKNSSKTGKDLINSYKKQLYYYKMAVETSFGVKIDDLVIYSFKDGNIYYL